MGAPPRDTPAPAPAGMGRATARVALLFPGQGSQTADMQDLVEAHRPDLMQLAVEEVGFNPFERIDEGTHCAQPALYAASLACWERAGRPDADLFAGHSLGELAALAAAGSLDHGDGLRLAAARGALMREAAERGAPGGMLAVLADVESAERLAAEHGLTVANRNAPKQTVLSGPDAALEAADEAARADGLRSVRLPVRGAFHSEAMEPAVAPFRARLDEVEFRAPRAPVISSVSAAPFGDPRSGLAAALTAPVRWTDTLRALLEAGVGRFVEAGPGKVLANLTRRSLEGVESVSLDQGVKAGA